MRHPYAVAIAVKMNWRLSISNELDLPTCAKEPRTTGIVIAREVPQESNHLFLSRCVQEL